ncbi:GspE/PulE family protein [Candidatus Xianfuyuplasma coldseepsis]|uniref:Flp pilus assembly complex ATPase component n=1 Tax=Candidatus Xianfuyuplasma coldseepsis TaxID=2782163 RepID=A0A7L7KU37_9MOLU|nr:ATPase, T2SS/T4P/T4SS family [Xianfuyuplasma coldseepsis]QMS85929.1 Flp pilus assembly complex ATPase component [Xianfuyuplasma coldseepsis]
MARNVQKRLGDVLFEQGVVTEKQINEALRKREKGEKIGEALIRFGFCNDSQIVDALEASLGIRRVNLQLLYIDESVLKLLDEEFVTKSRIMPINIHGRRIVIATNDPLDFPTIENVRLRTGMNVETVLATQNDIDTAIARYYGFTKTLKSLGIEVKEKKKEDEKFYEELLQDTEGDSNESPIIQLVNQILLTAVKSEASDIHIDPSDIEFKIRYRIDGVLGTERTLPKVILSKLISRIKVMSHMDITETRLPQDGRIKTIIEGRPIDLRISTLPTIRGEKAVMRVLDLSRDSKGLDRLGLDPQERTVFEKLIHRPNGIVLVSGPTGSGKTTTLYASLDQLNADDVNIITVEDPVEIELEGINQVNVNPDIDFTFANALRSILRQDPNIIMVGEIRDSETAEIAVKASLTGHLVLSTIHTNSAVKTITRLIDMGIDAFLVASSLSGVVAQRLLRVVCPHCSTVDKPTKTEQEVFERNGVKIDKMKRAHGCEICNNKGYKGRTAIFEILDVNETIIRMISNDAREYEILEQARKDGTNLLIEAGLKKVQEGVTTLEEVMRISLD